MFVSVVSVAYIYVQFPVTVEVAKRFDQRYGVVLLPICNIHTVAT